ncbi:lanthionine synthetase C family protein [Bacillus subtilis]|uniref:lanthionine synthetase C family protein n=1 Tax=Bacillus subtilis TaxID=1423 RepID=UPI003BB97755
MLNNYIDKIIIKTSKQISDLQLVLNLQRLDDISVASGISSVCILFAELDYTFPNRGWDRIGHDYLIHIKKKLEGMEDYSPSCLGGMGGIGFCILALSKNGNRYRNFLTDFNLYYFDIIKKHIEEFKDLSSLQKNDLFLYETIYGFAGIGRYLLFFRDQRESRDLLEKILVLITRMANKNVNSLADEKYVLDCGLAHGVSGPLSLLSLSYINNIIVEGQLDAIKKISNFLIKTKTKSANGYLFPNGIILNEKNKDQTVDITTRDAWCYGSPGTCRALLLAKEATGDAKYSNCAVTVFKDVIKRNFEQQKNYSPTFCHGLSGLLTITFLFNESIRDPKFKSYQIYLVKKLLGYYNDNNVLGFQNIERDNLNKEIVSDELGILNGVTGVLLTLLAFRNQMTYTRWESILLLN